MKDNLISRKTVINGLDYIITELDKLIEEDPLNGEYHHTKKQVEEIKNGVQNLSFTHLKRQKGEWLANGDIHKECPFCGENWDKYVYGDEVWYTGELPNFCPNCGADMRGDYER